MKTPTRGQAGAEVVITVVFILGALLAVMFYIQRAYAGYLYAQSSGHGQQFDPTSAYLDTRSLNSYSVLEESVTKVVTPSLAIDDGFCDDANPTGGGCAPDVAGGTFDGNVLVTQSLSNANWDVTRNANFTAN